MSEKVDTPKHQFTSLTKNTKYSAKKIWIQIALTQKKVHTFDRSTGMGAGASPEVFPTWGTFLMATNPWYPCFVVFFYGNSHENNIVD